MTRKRLLSITLYSLIPDAGQDNHKSFTKRLKQEFEELHPEINLKLHIGPEHNASDPDYLEKAFTDEFVDGIEIDAMNLSFLVSKGWALPVTEKYSSDERIYPQAVQAFVMDNKLYAYPSALCSCFIFSRHKEILEAQNIWELLTILKNKDEATPKILGNFLGPTILPIFYGLFYIGMHGADKADQALTLPLDPKVIRVMKDVIEDTIKHGYRGDPEKLATYTNPNPYWAIYDYAEKKSHSCIGFSEDMYHILHTDDTQPIYYVPALFGYKQPILFANGFVTNAINCTDERKRDVESFAKYFRSNEAMKWRSLSEDTSSFPRYLLSPREDFYEDPSVINNVHLQNFRQALKNGVMFPNNGYTERRNEIAQEIYKNL